MGYILMQRYSDNTDSTLGLLFLDQKFECYTLEDEYRKVKVKGETRIQSGIYELGIMESLTPLTKKYRSKFFWFEYHLHVKNVPNFKSIYIHILNEEDETDGCIGVGNTTNNNQIKRGYIGNSTDAFRRLYQNVYNRIKSGEKFKIEIRDESYI